MKYSLCTIGILGVLLPTIASAQCPASGTAQALLSQTPTGHYTAAVLQRVREGITNAKALPASTADEFALSKTHYLITLVSTMFMLVDTDLRAVEYSRDLESITPCLHLDLAMLEAKMEEVRCEMNIAFDNRAAATIDELSSIASFLNERYRNLVRGALEPKHVDSFWVEYHSFDNPFEGWCCDPDAQECQIKQAPECVNPSATKGGYEFYDTKDKCTSENNGCIYAESGTATPPYEDICPFDSNYLADNGTGYGCRLDLINTFAGSSYVSAQAEAQGLQELTNERNTFLNDVGFVKQITESMDDYTDNTMLTDDEREHLTHFGEGRTLPPKRVFGCDADALPAEPAPQIKPSEEWGTIALRSPFSFVKNQLVIWKKFFSLQHEWVIQREFPGYMRWPHEFADDTEREEAAEEEVAFFGLFSANRPTLRAKWLEFMHWQATQEAAILPKAQDAQQEVIRTLGSLRTAMKRNVDMVNQSDRGLRKFARNYAYFLRRSCIYRPCNERLEVIMKALYTDECFPYASGEFKVLDDDAAPSKTSWEKCQEEIDKL